MQYLVLLGRIFYSLIFITSSFGHLSGETIAYAASAGVFMPHILVPFAGLLSFVGGISILLGYYARFGAFLIALFLIPVTVTMHAFWTIADPANAYIQQILFMKNISMLGSAFLIIYFGSGPLSLKK